MGTGIASVARKLVERSTRNWSFRRRLPASFGNVPIIVSPSASLSYLFRRISNVDQALLRNATELVSLGDVVWDLGANVGLFTFAAAYLSGSGGGVVAIEPDEWLAGLLRRSATLQPSTSAPVEIISAAVAASHSPRSFNVASRSRSLNALSGYGHPMMGDVAETKLVDAVSIDGLLDSLPHPTIMKCDIEGAEIEIFAGEMRLLKEVRPIVICEVRWGSEKPITGTFLKAGYRLFDGDRPLSSATETNEASWNTIAIPEEKVAAILL
jgi:FkbM family methyltransferase